jgi:hypothetical protein
MSIQSRRIRQAIVCGALSLGLVAGPLTFATGAAAQDAKLVDPNAAKAGQSPHDAALAAAARGDYIAAVDLAKKSAAAGQPLDADQVDFMTQKAAKQQAALDQKAKDQAAQASAAATAEQIQARQQAEYAKRGANQQNGVQSNANCRQAEGGQVQTATNVVANGFNRGGTVGPVTAEGGSKAKCG